MLWQLHCNLTTLTENPVGWTATIYYITYCLNPLSLAVITEDKSGCENGFLSGGNLMIDITKCLLSYDLSLMAFWYNDFWDHIFYLWKIGRYWYLEKIGTSVCFPLSHYNPLRGTEVSAQAESTYDQSSPVLTEVTHASKNSMVSLLWLSA